MKSLNLIDPHLVPFFSDKSFVIENFEVLNFIFEASYHQTRISRAYFIFSIPRYMNQLSGRGPSQGIVQTYRHRPGIINK